VPFFPNTYARKNLENNDPRPSVKNTTLITLVNLAPQSKKPYYLIMNIMKIEYHNLYTHFILIAQNRIPSIPQKNRERIEKYITGVVNNNHSKLYSIYANPEHIHFLVSRSPRLSEEILATIVADSSLKFINENKLSSGVFAWQESASAFSVSKSDVDKVCKYILNQPEHHCKVSFANEYDELLKHYQKTLKWDIS
jgi:REP element-mobilizing transposase RayT